MSAENIPYHLRQNKAVDRAVFIDLLTKADRFVDIRNSKYVGFAGPFLEDLKLIHSHLGLNKLVSIERDHGVLERQRFNRPIKCVELYNGSSGDYIDQLPAGGDERHIVWLDYASPRQLNEQLIDFGKLCSKAIQGSILKITLNASPHGIFDEKYVQSENDSNYYVPVPPTKRKEFRLKRLNQRVTAVRLPEIATPDKMDKNGLPDVYKQLLRAAANMYGVDTNITLQPLTSFSYQDGNHQMMTFTGILLWREDIQDFFEKTGLRDWEFGNTDWAASPMRIELPTLSFRERSELDSVLPGADLDEVKERLGFKLDDEKNDELLDSYLKFYRLFPYFSKVAI